MDDREDRLLAELEEELGAKINDIWRLCDELSVIQAALLIAGCDPAGKQEYVEKWGPNQRPAGYDAAKTAITNALRRGNIKGHLMPHWDYDINGNRSFPIDNSVDIAESRVEVDSLRVWLAGRGFETGFFFPHGADAPDYLNQNHPNYAPKLAAAIGAWKAITSAPDLMRGTSAKQAMMKWLRKHADRFGLTKEDGNPNEQGIEEVAKIANWDAKGGAPRTPDANPTTR